MDYHAGTPALYIKIIFSHRGSLVILSLRHLNIIIVQCSKWTSTGKRVLKKQGNIFMSRTLSQPHDCLPSCSADAMYIIRVYPDSRVTVMRGANPN